MEDLRVVLFYRNGSLLDLVICLFWRGVVDSYGGHGYGLILQKAGKAGKFGKSCVL